MEKKKYVRERMVLKVQLPLMGNATPKILIYNEDRSFEAFLPIGAGIKRSMNGQPKAYFNAEVTTGPTEPIIHFKEMVEDPGW